MISGIDKQDERAASHYSNCYETPGWAREMIYVKQIFSEGLNDFEVEKVKFERDEAAFNSAQKCLENIIQ